MTNYIIKNDIVKPFPHYWEKCIGSCRAYTALREDYRQQIKKAHDELGFEYIRFHGLFNDDMSVCTSPLSPDPKLATKIVYNFANIDNIFDFLLSINMRPFIELGDMPSCIARDKTSCFSYHMHTSPPVSNQKWSDLIKEFVCHLCDRYGSDEISHWFFEVWNEPNNSMFWQGTQKEYFTLYETTAKTIKSIDERFKVGGPATACNMWIPEFIERCKSKQIPLDFITTHHYPTDETLWKEGSYSFEAMLKLILSGKKRTFNRDIMRQMAELARTQAQDYPLYYTEWSISSSGEDSLHDDAYAAAMAAKILIDNSGLVNGYSYWTFSDIFEECYQKPLPYHGGFGLLNYYGIPKAIYRCFEAFHNSGTEKLYVASDQPEHSHTGLIATRVEYGIQIIAYNYSTPYEKALSEAIKIELPAQFAEAKFSYYQIDDVHCNSKYIWQQMGAPHYLSPKEVDVLKQKSNPSRQLLNKLELCLPPQSVTIIEVHHSQE